MRHFNLHVCGHYDVFGFSASFLYPMIDHLPIYIVSFSISRKLKLIYPVWFPHRSNYNQSTSDAGLLCVLDVLRDADRTRIKIAARSHFAVLACI